VVKKVHPVEGNLPMTSELKVAEQAHRRLTAASDAWHTRTSSRRLGDALTVTDGPHAVRKQDNPRDMLRGKTATCFPSGRSPTRLDGDYGPAAAEGQEPGNDAARWSVASPDHAPASTSSGSPLGAGNSRNLEDPLLARVLAARLG